MSTIVIEGKNSYFLASRASLLVPSDREMAWAEKYVQDNPFISWVLGKYVEANRANHNKQFWALDDLSMAQPTISHAPMNLLHRPRDIVGAFVATEMMYPTDAAAADMQTCPECGASMAMDCSTCPDCGHKMAATAQVQDNPYVEALGAFWKYYFPNEYKVVEAAHNSGQLFFSMECIAKSITCDGEGGCGEEFAYAGPRSEAYCAHLNTNASTKRLNQPHFLAGALIFPPERPGWSGAEVKDLSSLVKQHQEEAELAYEGFKASAPHLTSQEWELAMLQVMAQAKMVARDVSPEERQRLAKHGMAMPDGSFPIANVQDLKNAIQAIGRAKDPAAAKMHIKRRAAALGVSNLIPEGW